MMGDPLLFRPPVECDVQRSMDLVTDLELIHTTLGELIPHYRALAERGQIELSTTPYSHPLAPLLIDFHSAHESQANLPRPSAPCYPGGRKRVDIHISAAISRYGTRFGALPAGIWPAEGAVSTALIQPLADHAPWWS